MDSPRRPADDEIAAVFAAMRSEAASREWGSVEELEAHMESVMARLNARPQADLGGLSPNDMVQLLHGDWSGPGPLRLVRNLPLDEIADAPWFTVARTLMQVVRVGGPIKATPKGNLPRAVVRLFLENILSEEAKERFGERGLGAVNEQDLHAIHIPRILLDMAGLVRQRKGLFVLTKAGRGLLPDASAGELFAVLFEACFRKLDLAYLDRAPEAPEFQHLIGFAMVRLRELARDWIPADRIDAEGLHPDLRGAIPQTMPEWDPITTLVERRLLYPLEQFNLVERREAPKPPAEPGDPWRHIREEVRKTPLYDRFLVDGRLRVGRE